MSLTHWKKTTNPNYLGTYALDEGKDMVLTIARIAPREMIVGSDGKKEECPVAHFVENVKPMILNSTNMKMIAKLYKTPYIEHWAGKKIQIGSEMVKAFGTITDALRIRDVIPESTEQKYYCEECKAEIQPFGGKSARVLAEYTRSKFGKALCSGCAIKFSEKAKGEAVEVEEGVVTDGVEVTDADGAEE